MDTEQAIAQLARAISHTAGESAAVTAATLGLLHAVRNMPQIRESVVLELEKAYTAQLHQSENTISMARFEEVKALAELAMQPDTGAQGSDAAG